MKKGFTLIELLVVVLIIGILSAVALPQYQKAVAKSRVAEAKIALKALQTAIHLVILEQGDTSNAQDSLSIEIPTSKYWTYEDEECPEGNCLFSATCKQDESITIYLQEEEYCKLAGSWPSCNENSFYPLVCFDDTGADKCKEYGFSKHLGDGYFVEY